MGGVELNSTLEKDLLKSRVTLVESGVLSERDYTQTSFNSINNHGDELTVFQLISVYSEYDGEMKVLVDGESKGEFFVQKGVNQVPLYLEVKKQITTYFVLDYKYKQETCLTENVKIKIS